MPPKFSGVSDRGEQMRHRSKNLHIRHMSDVRGAVGCYYCWIGQYSKCTSQCTLVRVTDRDHRTDGGSVDHRDVLYAWDHAAPVLTHAAAQSSTFFNVPAPKEADKWVKSATSSGGKQFFSKEDYVSVSKHVPEENPWITSSRRQQNRDMLKSITTNVNQRDAARAEAHRARHETKLFSLLLPEQFVPPYKYAHGSVTVQATPYTQISMRQRADRGLSASPRRGGGTGAGGSSSHRRETLDGWGVYDNEDGEDALDAAADARKRAMAQRRKNEEALRKEGRPIFMQTKHGGRFVASGSAVFSGGAAKTPGGADGFVDDDEFGEDLTGQQVLSTAEQLRAALEGRSIKKLRQDRIETMRAKSAGASTGGAAVMYGRDGMRTPHSMRHGSSANPSVSMENTSGQVLSGRFSNAQAMPLPDSFTF